MLFGGLGRLAARYLPGGPVVPPSRWAATSNVELGYGGRGEKGARDKDKREKREGGSENRGGAIEPLAEEGAMALFVYLCMAPWVHC